MSENYRKLDEKQWKEFLAALNTKPSGMEKLDALLKRPSPFEEDDSK